MTDMPGYNGRLLRVDLTNRRLSPENISPDVCRKYLGGAGFVAYYLWKEVPPGTDSLGPANKLVFALGPASGLLFPGSARNCIGAKSPLTGGVAKSEVGESWAAEMKRAGFDIVVVEGRSDRPVYLWIHDGHAEIKDASSLWGSYTAETQASIRSELGDERVRIASIGPGGENLVRYACVMNGLFDAAGRGGLGAVMGSKRLKAIAVRGTGQPVVANSEAIRELRSWFLSDARRLKSFREYGTGVALPTMEAIGNLPVRNFRDGLFPEAGSIGAEAVKNTIRQAMDGCFACPVRCKKRVAASQPRHIDPAYGGPEYETLASLGSNCGISDLQAICKGNELCNANSLDTISTGATIAFAMECFEAGLLTKGDTSGIDLRFGNADAMLEVIDLIARRKGVGALLAEGSARAAREIGNGAENFAVHSKGLEAGMHDPRVKAGLGLGYMVNPHGADHCCNMHDTAYTHPKQLIPLNPLGFYGPYEPDEIGPRKVALFTALQLHSITVDSLVTCLFFPYSYQQLSDLVAAITGWKTGVPDLMRMSQRTLTVARLFNIGNGLTSADDTLPPRFYQPKTDGVLEDKPLDRARFEAARSYYYLLMGWDRNTGAPLPERLEELEIV